MSDTPTPTPADVAPPAQAPDVPAPEPKVDDTDWKAEARKWEQRAKENAPAVKRLAEIEQASMSSEQKAEAAERRAIEAEARVVRRDLALEHNLSKDDAALLDTITDEDAMRRLAERLASAESDRKKQGNHVPREGNPPTSSSNADDASFARDLLGS